MNKWLVILIPLIGLNLIGCSNNDLNNKLSGEKPPKTLIEIENETYETELGSYCWGEFQKDICVDKDGPVELLKGKVPIKVKPGEKISFLMNYEPQPNKINVIQIKEKKESNVVVKDNQIKAPVEKGVYYYSYGVWWMNEKELNVSHGDALYAFVLEVK